MSKTIRYLVPVGMLGGGFSEDHFTAALTDDLAFIAVDSGSTDGGANNLGENIPFFSRPSIKRDLRLLLTATRRLDIPLLVGSCGGSGGNGNLEYIWDIVREVAAEESLTFTTAVIPAEVDREVLVEKYRAGRILPLDPAPPIDESTFRDTERIVAMMGAEPFQQAIAGGADVVLAGRASDAALMAAVPVMLGFDAGLAWHAAKIAECGGACVAQMTKPEGIVVTIGEDYFELDPVSPEQTCTPLSVASHALYETSDPVRMSEPGGTMMLDGVTYEAVSDRVVRVRGSRFLPAPYTVKLEGAGLLGYRAVVLGGITDPMILRDLDGWLAAAQDGAMHTLRRGLGDEDAERVEIWLTVYGRNGVLGDREQRPVSTEHEVAVLINVLAPTRELARDAVAIYSHTMLHRPVPAWHGLVSNLAFPFAPHEVEVGPSYSFVLNHVVAVEDPMELYSIEYREV